MIQPLMTLERSILHYEEAPMGHLVGKDVYRMLGEKIDGLETRAPQTETLYAILKELYTAEEAELVVRMPHGLSSLERLEQVTGVSRDRLKTLLDALASKGLVLDILVGDSYRYAPSPVIVGIFEFTMMRVGPEPKMKELARLFHEYLGACIEANFGHGEKHTLFRTVPHEEAIRDEDRTEILDHESAAAILAGSDRFALAICSCRHVQEHLGEKRCEVPLESCTAFGTAADYLIRNGLAREASRGEMEERFADSRERGLVLTVDNVRKNMRFVCHCCGCCCSVLRGVREHGYPNVLVTSSYLAGVDAAACTGCGKCARACPIGAIALEPTATREIRKERCAAVDRTACLGCGVCALSCRSGALKLASRAKRVIPPESTFERVILQCLERGTLQNQIFDDPNRFDQKALRAFVGGVLRLPPVKRALLSETLQSRFLSVMKGGVTRQGKGWVLQL